MEGPVFRNEKAGHKVPKHRHRTDSNRPIRDTSNNDNDDLAPDARFGGGNLLRLSSRARRREAPPSSGRSRRTGKRAGRLRPRGVKPPGLGEQRRAKRGLPVGCFPRDRANCTAPRCEFESSSREREQRAAPALLYTPYPAWMANEKKGLPHSPGRVNGFPGGRAVSFFARKTRPGRGELQADAFPENGLCKRSFLTRVKHSLSIGIGKYSHSGVIAVSV